MSDTTEKGLVTIINEDLGTKYNYVTDFMLDFFKYVIKEESGSSITTADFKTTLKDVIDKTISLINKQVFNLFIKTGGFDNTSSSDIRLVSDGILYIAKANTTKDIKVSDTEYIYGSDVEFITEDSNYVLKISKGIIYFTINGISTEYKNTIKASNSNYLKNIQTVITNTSLIYGNRYTGFNARYYLKTSESENYSYRKNRKNVHCSRYGEFLNICISLYNASLEETEKSNDFNGFLKKYFYKKLLSYYKENSSNEVIQTKTKSNKKTSIFPTLKEKFNGKAGKFKSPTTLLSMKSNISSSDLIDVTLPLKGIYFVNSSESPDFKIEGFENIDFSTSSKNYLGFRFSKKTFLDTFGCIYGGTRQIIPTILVTNELGETYYKETVPITETILKFFQRCFCEIEPTILNDISNTLYNQKIDSSEIRKIKSSIEQQYIDYKYADQYSLNSNEDLDDYIIFVESDGDFDTFSCYNSDESQTKSFLKLEKLPQAFEDNFISQPKTISWVEDGEYESFGDDRSVDLKIYHKNSQKTTIENYDSVLYLKVPVLKTLDSTEGNLLNYDYSNITNILAKFSIYSSNMYTKKASLDFSFSSSRMTIPKMIIAEKAFLKFNFEKPNFMTNSFFITKKSNLILDFEDCHETTYLNFYALSEKNLNLKFSNPFEKNNFILKSEKENLSYSFKTSNINSNIIIKVKSLSLSYSFGKTRIYNKLGNIPNEINLLYSFDKPILTKFFNNKERFAHLLLKFSNARIVKKSHLLSSIFDINFKFEKENDSISPRCLPIKEKINFEFKRANALISNNSGSSNFCLDFKTLENKFNIFLLFDIKESKIKYSFTKSKVNKFYNYGQSKNSLLFNFQEADVQKTVGVRSIITRKIKMRFSKSKANLNLNFPSNTEGLNLNTSFTCSYFAINDLFYTKSFGLDTNFTCSYFAINDLFYTKSLGLDTSFTCSCFTINDLFYTEKKEITCSVNNPELTV